MERDDVEEAGHAESARRDLVRRSEAFQRVVSVSAVLQRGWRYGPAELDAGSGGVGGVGRAVVDRAARSAAGRRGGSRAEPGLVRYADVLRGGWVARQRYWHGDSRR